MSGKLLQLSPRTGTRFTSNQVVAQGSTNALSAKSLDMGVIQSWIEADSDFDEFQDGVNWRAISGFALAVAISASCWAGVAWVVTHILR